MGALLTDISKAFNCLLHDLLITKFNAYGFDMPFLKFVRTYLSNRKQKIKFNDKFISWEETIFGVLQGSILGSLYFNIFQCDIFLFTNDTDIANYSDEHTPYGPENTTCKSY